jgi:hypothetical protein
LRDGWGIVKPHCPGYTGAIIDLNVKTCIWSPTAMKVIRQTHTQLVLEQRLIGIWFLGAFLAFVGLMFTLGFIAPLYIVGALCIAAGSLLEILTPVEICDLDKERALITLIQRRWLRRHTQRYPLAQVQQVRVDKTNYLGANFYTVCLKLASGKALNLTLFPTTDRQKQEKTAARIQSFLAAGRFSAPSLR